MTTVEADVVLSESTYSDAGWLHHCGSLLMAQRVYHPVWDGPFPLTGGGEVRQQLVPYCPACHEPPSHYGPPITPKMTDWPRVRLVCKPSARYGP